MNKVNENESPEPALTRKRLIAELKYGETNEELAAKYNVTMEKIEELFELGRGKLVSVTKKKKAHKTITEYAVFLTQIKALGYIPMHEEVDKKLVLSNNTYHTLRKMALEQGYVTKRTFGVLKRKEEREKQATSQLVAG